MPLPLVLTVGLPPGAVVNGFFAFWDEDRNLNGIKDGSGLRVYHYCGKTLKQWKTGGEARTCESKVWRVMDMTGIHVKDGLRRLGPSNQGIWSVDTDSV